MRKFLPWMVRQVALLSFAASMVLAPSGCANKSGESQYTRFPSGVKNRPRVETSAAEMHVTARDIEPSWGPGVSELNFFDELETRGEVVNDDALHACLLLGTGVSLPDYDDRVGVAQRLGWLRRKPARPPREAATIGEVSRIMVRMMGDKRRVTPARATERLQQMGLLPGDVKHYQGLNGAQMVSLLGQVEEAMGPADFAAVRASARDNWYSQAVVDDGDGDESNPVDTAAAQPSAAPSPAESSVQGMSSTNTGTTGDAPAEPAPSNNWRKGSPLRKPGN